MSGTSQCFPYPETNSIVHASERSPSTDSDTVGEGVVQVDPHKGEKSNGRLAKPENTCTFLSLSYLRIALGSGVFGSPYVSALRYLRRLACRLIYVERWSHIQQRNARDAREHELAKLDDFWITCGAVVLRLMRDKISKESTEPEAEWALAIMDSCPNGRRIVKSDFSKHPYCYFFVPMVQFIETGSGPN